MRLKASVGLSALCGLLALSGASRANMVVSAQTYTLGGSPNTDTLAINGWVGVLLTVTSDGLPVGGFDLDSNGGGIFGNFEQAQFTTDGFGVPLGTPQTTPKAPVPSAPGLINIQDSHFSDFPGMVFGPVIGHDLAENNNSSNNAGAPLQTVSGDYTFVPLADTTGNSAVDYGIGTILHGAGAFTSGQTNSLPFAFVIVPRFSQIQVTGVFADSSQTFATGFSVNQTLAAAPEPASLAVLALGGLGLLARRRK
jgi:hypothetical protein